MDYKAANKANSKFKSALTRARNKKDYRKVIAVIDATAAEFARNGWPLPDNWSHVEVLRDDAERSIRYADVDPFSPTGSF